MSRIARFVPRNLGTSAATGPALLRSSPRMAGFHAARLLRPARPGGASSVRCFSQHSRLLARKDPSKQASQKKDDAKKDENSEGSDPTSPETKDAPTDAAATPKEESSAPQTPPSSGERVLKDGRVWLKADELQALSQMEELLPQDAKSEFSNFFKEVSRHGAPHSLKELLRKHVDTGLSLMETMKLGSTIMGMIRNKGPEQSTPGTQGSQQAQQQQQGQKQQKRSGGTAGGNNEPPKEKTDNSTTIIIALIALLAYEYLYIDSGSGREITWQEFRARFLDKGLVERLIVTGDLVRVQLNRDATLNMYGNTANLSPYFYVGSRDALERKMDMAQDELQIPTSEQIPISYQKESVIPGLVMSLLPTLLVFGLIGWSMRGRGGGGGIGGAFRFGKSQAKMFNHESAVKVKFSDVAGMDEAKVEIVEFVSFLKTPDKFVRLGAKIPRGAILSGPPGTGKTLLAKATAGESGVPFFSVSGSEFVEMFVGVGASRVRDLFAQARKHAPCIIFIDEIDAIGKSRESSSRFGGNDERETTLNQILTEMDGFNTEEQIVVLAGTNRPEILDKALMRPGRFDRHIYIDRPTMKGRSDIFRVHLAKVFTKEDMDQLCGRLAALTPGFAGADIANVVNEAALVAARDNAESVTMVHFERAIERVIGGLERKSLVLGPEEKRTVAYHEAGHAICGWYFEYADPLLKVSIIPRGQGALGYAQYLPQGDAYLMNVNQLMDRMAMTLGGRVSEELHFPTVTTGASDDFKKVTQMATTMVTQWGMSEKLGPLHFNQDQNQVQKPFAESTAQTIDAEVRRIVDEAYAKCRAMLTEKKKEVGIVAEELLRREQLTRDDLVRLLGPRPFEEKAEFSKYFDGRHGGAAPFGGGSSGKAAEDAKEPPAEAEATDGPQPALFVEDAPERR